MEQKELKERFEQYKERIVARQKAGEKIDLKSFKDWVRTGKDKEGKEIPVPGESGETRLEKGVRVGERRMSAFVKACEGLDNLKYPEYAFTEEQVNKMIKTIETQVDDLKTMLKMKIGQGTEERKVVETKFKF